MKRRPDIDRSRAVLIGVSRYEMDEQPITPGSEALPPLDSVSANLTDLRQLLTDPDLGTFTSEHCELLENPQRPHQIGDIIASAAREAEDVLLVYYAGHGLVDSRGRLYLGLPGTNPAQTSWTSLPFETLREALLDSPAKIRILILDCCFSGRAFESMGDDPALQARWLDIDGTYTLASSAANEPSFAPVGEPHTAFTGALLATARKAPGITLEELYRGTQIRLAAQSRPEPHRRSVNAAGELVIFGHPQPLVASAAAAIEQHERTFEFDEARRVAPSVAVNPIGPGFWNVTIRNGSATPITQLKVDVYPVNTTGSRTDDECVAAKGHPALVEAFDYPRAQLRAKLGWRAGAMIENPAMRLATSRARKAMTLMANSYPDSLAAGTEETILYFAPTALTVRADLTFTDTSGNIWTRSHIQTPRPA
ncbi:caspase family protein (plasmid) [Rhodococcus qingshengii]|uniref:caspase family protein n=1 Tax=Rhodococcus qingshengii TaxID=334542 RepID=UPI00311C8DF6